MALELVRKFVNGAFRYVAEEEATGGGLPPVSCVLAQDAGVDIHDSGNHPILWDALYDNLWDFGAIDAIPEGLGLDFAFDGTSGTIITTMDGIWSFSYQTGLALDNAFQGNLSTGLQQVGIYLPNPILTQVAMIPTGVSLAQAIDTLAQAASDPYTASVYLSIVKLG